MEGKRRRELQLFTPVKRICPYVSPHSLIPDTLSPDTQRERSRALSSVMVAAQQGSLACVEYHLQTRGLHLLQGRYGPHSRSLLHLAAKAESLPLTTYLRTTHKVEVALKDDLGFTALELTKSPELREFLEREVRWEQRKGLLFCYHCNIPLLRRVPESVFRAIFSEGFY